MLSIRSRKRSILVKITKLGSISTLIELKMNYGPKSYEPPPISKHDQTKTSDFNPIETCPYNSIHSQTILKSSRKQFVQPIYRVRLLLSSSPTFTNLIASLRYVYSQFGLFCMGKIHGLLGNHTQGQIRHFLYLQSCELVSGG